jgi:hypothetical protein
MTNFVLQQHDDVNSNKFYLFIVMTDLLSNIHYQYYMNSRTQCSLMHSTDTFLSF